MIRIKDYSHPAGHSFFFHHNKTRNGVSFFVDAESYGLLGERNLNAQFA